MENIEFMNANKMEGKEKTRWDSAASRWGDKCYPVRPSTEAIKEIFQEKINETDGAIMVMGATPEFREALAKRGYDNLTVVLAEVSPSSFEAMSQLMDSDVVKKERASGRVQLIQSLWQEVPAREKSIDLILGDLALNIVYKEEKGKDTSLEEHVSEQNRILTNLQKNLKDKGKLVLRTWVLPESLEKSEQYRNIQDVFEEWEQFKKDHHKREINIDNQDDRKFVFSFFANRLIRHYQDETGKFVCRDMAELIKCGQDREGNLVDFPDGIDKIMSWHWQTYEIPNWMLPQDQQETIMKEFFDIKEVIVTDDDLSIMAPIYVLENRKNLPPTGR